MSTQSDVKADSPAQLHRDLLQLRLMALGFGIGSVLFGAGAVVSLAGGSANLANVLFAIGAVFFTSAAAVQLIAAVDHFPPTLHPVRKGLTDPDLSSAVIQLIGTIYFNVMTLRAVLLPPTAADYEQVWQPDVIGSACFLISSWIAWHPVARARKHRRIPERSHLILWSNMLGSVFFAVSAWGAKLVGEHTVQNQLWDNLGTLLGAIGFLSASWLMWPHREASYGS